MKDIKMKFILFFTLILFFIPIDVFAENKLNFQEEIAPGVIRYEYEVPTSNSRAIVNVVKVDLNNKKIKLNTVAGKGKYTQKATVSQMADRTNAVAFVNGDFFNMSLQGVPLGASIIDGDLKSSSGVLTDMYSFGIDVNDIASIEATTFVGTVVAPNGVSYKIDGLNKTAYWYQPSKEYSHESKIQMYNEFWESKSRGDKTAGEVLLDENNIVEQIVFRKNLDMKIPQGKKILQVSGNSEKFIIENVKVGDKLQITYGLNPSKNWKMLISGHSLLVENGAIRKYTKDISSIGGTRARTAVAIADGGKTVYIVAVEGRTKKSSGMTLTELSNFLVDLKVDKALNLDGGGSTAMAIRNLGDIKRTRVTNPERNAGERAVVNGLGVYNTTKNSGIIVNGKLNGEKNPLIGEATTYTLKSAWDGDLNPIDIQGRNYTIKEESGKNIFNGRDFLGLVPGKYTLNVSTDKGETFSRDINVSSEEVIESLKIKPSTNRISVGDKVTFEIFARSKGKDIKLSPRVFQFDYSDLKANLDLNTSSFIVNEMGDSPKFIARIGNKEAVLNLNDKSKKTINMYIDKKEYLINDEKNNMDVAPFIQDERTMVPLRFIAEGFGAEVNWNEEDKTAIIKKDDKIIQVPIDKKEIIVNGEIQNIDTKAIIKSERTFVPVRFISEALNMKVSYNGENREVIIQDEQTSEIKEQKNPNSENINQNSQNSEVINQGGQNVQTINQNKSNSGVTNQNNQSNQNSGKLNQNNQSN